MKIKPILAAMFALSASSNLAFAISYNDPFWASPNANTDFVDHFATNSLNRGKWSVETSIWVNGEDQDYKDVEYPAADWTLRSGQDEAGALDGKALNLKARYMDGIIEGYYGGVAGQGKPLFIRAGRIESLITDNTTFTFGKFEARIKMPPARNAEFPAWWLLGNFPDVGWTACQELDIIEFTGKAASVSIANTEAPQTRWQAPYPAFGGNPNKATYGSLGINPTTQFITYGVIKTPDAAEFYINGVKTFTFGRADRADMPWPYVTPMRMILNHAITHTEWPGVGNYNSYSTNANVANRTGYSRVTNGVTEYEYIDTAAMNVNLGRIGTDFLVDYVAHWPLPSSDPSQKYTDDSKYSFFRATNNTKGFYPLKGWMAPVAVTADAYLLDGINAVRDNGAKNAADGYVGSKWATPKDDNLHSVEIDYGMDKPIKYFWIEWSWNLPKSYDIYGKTSSGAWEFILSSNQDSVGWATHVFDVNKTFRHIKLVTKGRIDKSDSIWLLEFKAFEDVANVYPKPAGTAVVDRAINILGNGSFATDLNGWKSEAYDGATPVFASVNGEAKITTGNQGSGFGSVQLHAEGFNLKRNYRYQVSFRARAESARNLQVRLSEDNLNPSAAGTYLLNTVALGTTMTAHTFNLDFTRFDTPARLAFLMGNMGTATVYIDDVVIREIAYIGVGEPLVKAIDATNFVSASAGWEPEWWGDVKRAIDGSTGNKASGNDGQAEGMELSLNLMIDPEYEIKEVLVAGDKSAPRSLAQFKVDYGTGAGTTMMNWTNSEGDGVYETFNTFASAPPANERNFKLSFRPPAGQLVEVSDVQFMAVDLKPHRIYTLGLDSGGSITPAGTLRYSKNNTDSATYTFTPPAGRTVANVIVDGVSQGPRNNYTFTNIAKSHTLAIAYSGSGVTSSTPSSTSVASSSTSSSSSIMPPVLVSAGRPTLASSQLAPASNAVDSNASSRWESAHGVSPSWISVDLGSAINLSSVVIDWEAANAATYSVQGSNDNLNWTSLKSVTGGTFGTRTDTHVISGSYRYVRILCNTPSVGNNWGYSIWELKVFGSGVGVSSSSVPSSVASSIASSSVASSIAPATLLTPTAASASTQIQPASAAIDKNAGTRWESAVATDPSWLTLDFGTSKKLSSIAIDWEAANAGTYSVQGSNDNVNWTILANRTGGTFGNRTDTLALLGSYRYVRIHGTARSPGNQWGYSIFEVRVMGW